VVSAVVGRMIFSQQANKGCLEIFSLIPLNARAGTVAGNW